MPMDNEIRCDDHIGDAHAARCAQCETLRAEFSLWPNLTAPKTDSPESIYTYETDTK
jgi:hypothetical protein